eukprot:TRINITY_DN8204_c0_g1_i1.p1 TRINITY_DN8204_c0_g1~~TRINITY_DN8204_c0_g1_i1.p1  ORF type:complete len:792 (-),score=157.14 TRINITY_DN8204_c0_g1_i1:193-2568(-)
MRLAGFVSRVCYLTWHLFFFLFRKYPFQEETTDSDCDEDYHTAPHSDEEVLQWDTDDEWLPQDSDEHVSSSGSDSEVYPFPMLRPSQDKPVLTTDKHSLHTHKDCTNQSVDRPSDCTLDPLVVSQSQGKKWNKQHSCKFCQKLVIKMSDHLERVHGSEPEVARVSAMRKGSAERRRAWGKLVNEGDFEHNFLVISANKGTLIPKYRSQNDRKVVDLVPCSVCKGMYKRTLLGKHIQVCGTKHGVSVPKKGKTAVIEGQLLTSTSNEMNPLFFRKVIGKMKDDEIKRSVLKDSLILKYGLRLFMRKDHEEHTPNHISQRMRNLAMVVIALKEKQINSLAEALSARNMDTLIKAVQKICAFDENTNTFGKGSKALKIGYSLKRCSSVLKTEALKEGNDALKAQVDGFEGAFEADWLDFVSSCARQSMEKAKFNVPKLLPTCQDVHKLYTYLKQLRSDAGKSEDYSDLAQRVLCQISLLNRKRGGEVQRMKVSEYEHAQKKPVQIDPEVEASLSPVEQKLSTFLQRVEIRGKYGRRVAILLTPQMQEDIHKIMQKRKQLDIQSEYLFATRSGERPYRGCDVIQRYSKDAGVSNSALFTWTSMRKQLATISQVMEITDGEQDMLATFLDHDIRVHRNVYRLPLDLLQKARVAKILLAANTGATISSEMIEQEMNNNGQESLEDETLFMDVPIAEDATSEDDDEDETSKQPNGPGKSRANKKHATKTVHKKTWTAEEKAAIFRQLNSCIVMNKVPQQSQAADAIAKEPALSNRSWKSVKFFVYNIIQKKKRKAVHC